MPNPKTDPVTLHTQTWVTQQQGFSPIRGDAAGMDWEPGSVMGRAKYPFWGHAGLSDAAPIDTVEAAGSVMGPFHPPRRSSDFWAATQIVPKVLILLSYRGA